MQIMEQFNFVEHTCGGGGGWRRRRCARCRSDGCRFCDEKKPQNVSTTYKHFLAFDLYTGVGQFILYNTR